MNEKKVEEALTKIKKILNKNKLTIPELLLLYGNLGYHIGASMAGLKDKGPGLEEVKQAYYVDGPTVDVGLMLQGQLITSWVEDFNKHPKLSKFAKINIENKEKK